MDSIQDLNLMKRKANFFTEWPSQHLYLQLFYVHLYNPLQACLNDPTQPGQDNRWDHFDVLK